MTTETRDYPDFGRCSVEELAAGRAIPGAGGRVPALTGGRLEWRRTVVQAIGDRLEAWELFEEDIKWLATSSSMPKKMV